MADVLLTIEEVAKQLQLSKDQVTEMAKKGLLRGFRDENTYKFRAADVEAFKKKLTSGATTLSDSSPKTDAIPGGTQGRKDGASKIDLAEVESDSGVADTDQTSVLAPVEPAEKKPEKPVFKFGAKDIEFQEGEESAILDEGDQTSLLVPGAAPEEKGTQGVKPAFDFGGKEKQPPEGEAESVLVADESESSMDILEVAEESSSESASSASRISAADEGSSGEEIEAAETPSKFAKKPAPRPAPKPGEPTTDKVVTDILGSAPEESDEALETLDVEEAVEPKEEGAFKPPTAATVPVGDEHETVGLPGAEETKAAMGEAGEEGGMNEAVAAALQEQAAVEEPQEAEQQAPAAIRTGWESVQAWPVGNGLLIAATVLLILAGGLLFCDAFQIHNGFTAQIAEAVQSHLP